MSRGRRGRWAEAFVGGLAGGVGDRLVDDEVGTWGGALRERWVQRGGCGMEGGFATQPGGCGARWVW